MTHGKKFSTLQRTKSHREALLKNLCKSLIEHRRIRTTLAKAKALSPVADKLVTLGKRALNPQGKNAQERAANVVHLNRQAFAHLRDRDLVFKLFHEIAPASKDRAGGYTRITKLGRRQSDSAPMAFIEWVDAFVPKEQAPEPSEAPEAEAAAPAEDAKPKRARKAKADGEAAAEPAKAKKAKKAKTTAEKA